VTGNGNGALFIIASVLYAKNILERAVFGGCINMTTDERTIFAKLEALKEIR
jgi:hypothetical protein